MISIRTTLLYHRSDFQKVEFRQQLYLDITEQCFRMGLACDIVCDHSPGEVSFFSEQQRSRMELELPPPTASSEFECAPFAVAPHHPRMMLKEAEKARGL